MEDNKTELSLSQPIKPDIVPKLSKFLDRHLVFPLLEFLSSKEVIIL